MKKISLFSYLLSALILTGISSKAQHFTPVWSGGNPYLSMQIVVVSSSLDGNPLDFDNGDEIASFDIETSTGNEICVGIYNPATSVLVAGTDDPTTPGVQDGFIVGNSIIYRMWDNSENKEITLVDSVYSPPFNEYYESNGTTVVSLTGFSLNTWDGSEDGDWNNPDNWDNALAPNAGADVLIAEITRASFPDLTSSTGECNNITLEANASILGNGNLTVNGTAYVQTSISTDQWHMVSPPVNGQKAGVYHQGGDPKVFLTDYDEATETYNYIEDLNTDLTNMQGYMLWINSARTFITYSGTMNNGSFGSTDNLTRNTSGSGDEGWNMVGNPYPSSIDWDASSGWSNANIDDAIYIINNGTWASYIGTTGTNGGSRYIAPGQGFFVRVSSGNTTGTLQMDDDVRKNNNTSFLKARETFDFVKLALSGLDRTDETVIRFLEESTNDFDSQYDAYKKFATDGEIPQLYSHSDEEYSINSVQSAESMPLGLKCALSSEFTIVVVEYENIQYLWLEDQQTATLTDLTTESYTFNHESGNDPDRFILHFTAVSVNENQLDDINVFTYKSWVNVRSDNTVNGKVKVYNLLGQEVASDLMINGSCKIRVNKQGYYVVKVVADDITIARKVFIE